MTKRERAQIESMLELLKTEQRLDQDNMVGATESDRRYCVGMLMKAAEVIDMLEEILGGKRDV